MTSHSISKYLAKRNESTCPYKELYLNVFEGLICNRLKLGKKSNYPSIGESDK